MNPFYQQLAERIRVDGQATLYTVVESDRPGLLGQKALLTVDDTLHVEEESLRDFWEAELPACAADSTLTQLEAGAVFGERLARQPRLVLCGGGHIAQPLAAIGTMLGYSVVVLEDRAEFVDPARFPTADLRICAPFEEVFDRLEDHPNTDYVVITRGHAADRLCLEKILHRSFSYVGMIGSRRKVAVVMDQMKEDGYPAELLARVHAPIGLRIGAQTPAEIAVCIAAELIQIRRQNSGSSVISDEMLAFFADATKKFVSATIISKQGSAPREPGARMLVLEDGSICGSVGGGAGEAEVCTRAKEMMQNGAPCVIHCDMTNEDAKQMGMVCGGTIAVFLEKD